MLHPFHRSAALAPDDRAGAVARAEGGEDAIGRALAAADPSCRPEQALFPGPGGKPAKGAGKGSGTCALVDRWRQRLSALAALCETDPFANPILLLSTEIARQLEAGDLGQAAVEDAIQRLAGEAFLDRARRLRHYWGEIEPEANDERLTALFEALARADGAEGRAPVAFEEFKARVEREIFGVVMTAHPTFTLSGRMMACLVALATDRGGDGEPLDEAARRKLVESAMTAALRPDTPPTLDHEYALSVAALTNLHRALRRVYGLLLDMAARLYPDRWTELVPCLVSGATWVGYDLDGRSDIRWSDLIAKRFENQSEQFRLLLVEARAIAAEAGGSGPVAEAIELLESRVALSLSHLEGEIEAFRRHRSESEEDTAALAAISRRMFESRGQRITKAGALAGIVDRAIGRAEDNGIRRRLVILRAELANFGLGLARTHVRINATQVHNAIRREVGLTADPNDPRYRVTYIEQLNGLLDAVKPVRVNFGSVIAERMSVRQLFMVVAQMLKYGDRTAPIRFLIAETESAFTLLTALYFARLYDCADKVDISPLFETERALEAGSRVVEQLLDNPHYCAYVRTRGRICIQTGYSDAGRYLGQTPAAASIERLRLRLIRVMADRGLEDVDLLLFDTHGESIGRGAHPAGMTERLANIDTPATRGYFADRGVRYIQEMSFQGGDGYLHFGNESAAYATLTRILEHALAGSKSSADDPFYDEPAYIREFFTTVKEFQVSLMENPDYGVLLQAQGPNLLFQTGSRATRRQHEDASEVDHAHATQLRAIPHNAILQQMGILANSIGGVGQAIARDPERFADLYARSPRMRQLMGIVDYGLSASDPRAMHGLIALLDPHFWAVRAATAEPQPAEEMRRLADFLESMPLHERQLRVYRRLHGDAGILGEALERVRPLSPDAGTNPIARLGPPARERMALLHALRLALVQQIFLLAMRVPDFSPRHNTTPRQVLGRLIQLDVAPVVELLEEVFPANADAIDLAAFGEPADPVAANVQDYRDENERIFRPMNALYRLTQRISAGLMHEIGFLG